MESSFALYSGPQNTHLNAKDDTFKPVNTDILFLHKFSNFWYITRFVPNLKRTGSISWTMARYCYYCILLEGASFKQHEELQASLSL